MFPDPTLIWRPFHSLADGIKYPFVLDRGLWRGRLNLLLSGQIEKDKPASRTFLIEVDCEVYFAVEEMIYSVAPYDSRSGAYDGSVYIKEATTSRLRETFTRIDPIERTLRHFLFAGMDFCYETLGAGEPILRELPERKPRTFGGRMIRCVRGGMKTLPNAGIAAIDPRKVSNYLLDTGHPDGGPKARYLLRFGFSDQHPERLIAALFMHAQANEVVRLQKTPFGTNYIIEGPLDTPDGRNPKVRTIWAVDDWKSIPRLITLVPLRGRQI